MIKAIIVDDEPYCCEALSILLSRYCPQVEIAGVYHSGAHALEPIREQKPQLLFLDIEMPRMNGFELLEKVKSLSFELIFTTSYDQYAIKAIRFSALDEMRAQEQAHGFKERVAESTAPFFGAGQPGHWRSVLTPAQQARIEREHGAMMQRFGY